MTPNDATYVSDKATITLLSNMRNLWTYFVAAHLQEKQGKMHTIPKKEVFIHWIYNI